MCSPRVTVDLCNHQLSSQAGDLPLCCAETERHLSHIILCKRQLGFKLGDPLVGPCSCVVWKQCFVCSKYSARANRVYKIIVSIVFGIKCLVTEI